MENLENTDSQTTAAVVTPFSPVTFVRFLMLPQGGDNGAAPGVLLETAKGPVSVALFSGGLNVSLVDAKGRPLPNGRLYNRGWQPRALNPMTGTQGADVEVVHPDYDIDDLIEITDVAVAALESEEGLAHKALCAQTQIPRTSLQALQGIRGQHFAAIRDVKKAEFASYDQALEHRQAQRAEQTSSPEVEESNLW